VDKPVVNFFWHGDKFDFLCRLTIISHIVAGHHCVVWLYGPRPSSDWWIDDLEEVQIRDVVELVDVHKWITDNDADISPASNFFRCHLMLKKGGWYADLDVIATATWPSLETSNGWMVCRESDHGWKFGTGVMAAPKGHELFHELLTRIPFKGKGFVENFSILCAKYGITDTHTPSQFYPIPWNRIYDPVNGTSPLISYDASEESSSGTRYAIHLWASELYKSGGYADNFGFPLDYDQLINKNGLLCAFEVLGLFDKEKNPTRAFNTRNPYPIPCRFGVDR